MMRMGLAQQGHGSRSVSGVISAPVADSVFDSWRWTHSKARIFVMLALRAELASRP